MPAESVARYLLTVVLAGADLAASAWQQDGVGARGLGTLGLDVLAAHAAHDPPLLVDLHSGDRYKAGHNDLVKTEYMRHIFVNISFQQDREDREESLFGRICKPLDISTIFATQMIKFGFANRRHYPSLRTTINIFQIFRYFLCKISL